MTVDGATDRMKSSKVRLDTWTPAIPGHSMGQAPWCGNFKTSAASGSRGSRSSNREMPVRLYVGGQQHATASAWSDFAADHQYPRGLVDILADECALVRARDGSRRPRKDGETER